MASPLGQAEPHHQSVWPDPFAASEASGVAWLQIFVLFCPWKREKKYQGIESPVMCVFETVPGQVCFWGPKREFINSAQLI